MPPRRVRHPARDHATRWVVDPEANATLWRELSEMPLRLGGSGSRIADLGGGNGNFVSPLLRKGAWLVTVDVDRAARGSADPSIRPVPGSRLAPPVPHSSCAG